MITKSRENQRGFFNTFLHNLVKKLIFLGMFLFLPWHHGLKMTKISSGWQQRHFCEAPSFSLWMVSTNSWYLPTMALAEVQTLTLTFFSSTPVIWYPQVPGCSSLTLRTDMTVPLLCIGLRPVAKICKPVAYSFVLLQCFYTDDEIQCIYPPKKTFNKVHCKPIFSLNLIWDRAIHFR